MEEYKKELTARQGIYTMGISFLVIFFAMNQYFNFEVVIPNPHTADFVHGLFMGSAFSLEMILVVLTMKTLAALKDEKKLEAMYIEEKDERMAFIKNKIGGDFATFMTIFQLVAAIGLAFVDIRFTFVLYGVTMVECIIRLIMKVWYMKNI